MSKQEQFMALVCVILSVMVLLMPIIFPNHTMKKQKNYFKYRTIIIRRKGKRKRPTWTISNNGYCRR